MESNFETKQQQTKSYELISEITKMLKSKQYTQNNIKYQQLNSHPVE